MHIISTGQNLPGSLSAGNVVYTDIQLGTSFTRMVSFPPCPSAFQGFDIPFYTPYLHPAAICLGKKIMKSYDVALTLHFSIRFRGTHFLYFLRPTLLIPKSHHSKGWEVILDSILSSKHPYRKAPSPRDLPSPTCSSWLTYPVDVSSRRHHLPLKTLLNIFCNEIWDSALHFNSQVAGSTTRRTLHS